MENGSKGSKGSKGSLRSISKRHMVLGGAALTAASQTKWAKPVLSGMVLPAHAQTSETDVPPADVPPADLPPFFEVVYESVGSGTCVEEYIRSIELHGVTHDYVENFILINNSTVPVTIASVVADMAPNQRALVITRTDAALGTQIPAGGTAAFQATLTLELAHDPGADFRVDPGVCNDEVPFAPTIPDSPSTRPFVFPVETGLTVMINEDATPITATLVFDAV